MRRVLGRITVGIVLGLVLAIVLQQNMLRGGRGERQLADLINASCNFDDPRTCGCDPQTIVDANKNITYEQAQNVEVYCCGVGALELEKQMLAAIQSGNQDELNRLTQNKKDMIAWLESGESLGETIFSNPPSFCAQLAGCCPKKPCRECKGSGQAASASAGGQSSGSSRDGASSSGGAASPTGSKSSSAGVVIGTVNSSSVPTVSSAASACSVKQPDDNNKCFEDYYRTDPPGCTAGWTRPNTISGFCNAPPTVTCGQGGHCDGNGNCTCTSGGAPSSSPPAPVQSSSVPTGESSSSSPNEVWCCYTSGSEKKFQKTGRSACSVLSGTPYALSIANSERARLEAECTARQGASSSPPAVSSSSSGEEWGYCCFRGSDNEFSVRPPHLIFEPPDGNRNGHGRRISCEGGPNGDPTGMPEGRFLAPTSNEEYQAFYNDCTDGGITSASSAPAAASSSSFASALPGCYCLVAIEGVFQNPPTYISPLKRKSLKGEIISVEHKVCPGDIGKSCASCALCEYCDDEACGAEACNAVSGGLCIHDPDIIWDDCDPGPKCVAAASASSVSPLPPSSSSAPTAASSSSAENLGYCCAKNIATKKMKFRGEFGSTVSRIGCEGGNLDYEAGVLTPISEIGSENIGSNRQKYEAAKASCEREGGGSFSSSVPSVASSASNCSVDNVQPAACAKDIGVDEICPSDWESVTYADSPEIKWCYARHGTECPNNAICNGSGECVCASAPSASASPTSSASSESSSLSSSSSSAGNAFYVLCKIGLPGTCCNKKANMDCGSSDVVERDACEGLQVPMEGGRWFQFQEGTPIADTIAQCKRDGGAAAAALAPSAPLAARLLAEDPAPAPAACPRNPCGNDDIDLDPNGDDDHADDEECDAGKPADIVALSDPPKRVDGVGGPPNVPAAIMEAYRRKDVTLNDSWKKVIRDGDACDAVTCKKIPIPEICGDGVIIGAEKCDNGESKTALPAAVGPKCTDFPQQCGNGPNIPAEIKRAYIRNDPNLSQDWKNIITNGASCDAETCKDFNAVPMPCGDGKKAGNEECDPGDPGVECADPAQRCNARTCRCVFGEGGGGGGGGGVPPQQPPVPGGIPGISIGYQPPAAAVPPDPPAPPPPSPQPPPPPPPPASSRGASSRAQGSVSSAASSRPASSASSAGASARSRFCGDGNIDLKEDCDNGSVCAGGPLMGKRCLADSQCFVQLGSCKKGWCKNGLPCFSDDDCSAQYPCDYDSSKDPACTASCKRASAVSSASSHSSFSSLSSLSSPSSLSSFSSHSSVTSASPVSSPSSSAASLHGAATEPSPLCGNGRINPGESCDNGSLCVGGPLAGKPCAGPIECIEPGLCVNGWCLDRKFPCFGHLDCMEKSSCVYNTVLDPSCTPQCTRPSSASSRSASVSSLSSLSSISSLSSRSSGSSVSSASSRSSGSSLSSLSSLSSSSSSPSSRSSGSSLSSLSSRSSISSGSSRSSVSPVSSASLASSTSRSSALSLSSGAPAHLACVGASCAVVPGAGEPECLASLGCGIDRHLACVGTTCASVEGSGPNTCDSNLPCSVNQHNVCVNLACSAIGGTGQNVCSRDAECAEETHLACIGQTCTSVPGPGTNGCVNNTQCAQSSSRSSLTTVSLTCGNGLTESGEECDNGKVCIAGSQAGQPCAISADCAQSRGPCVGGFCSGKPAARCTRDEDCREEFGCVYNIIANPFCTEQCKVKLDECCTYALPVFNAETFEFFCAKGDLVGPICRDCSSCPRTASHLACVGASCAVVPGAGEPECLASLGCGIDRHLACVGTTCASVEGSGPNTCDSNLPCSVNQHNVCVNLACSAIGGTGQNVCSRDAECAEETHLACIGKTCTSVPGPGSNVCTSNTQCELLAASSASSRSSLRECCTYSDPLFNAETGQTFCRKGDLIAGRCRDCSACSAAASSGRSVGTSSAFCGNRTVNAGEECDDGNVLNGDGCDRFCKRETSLITMRCGNGRQEAPEACDDGNVVNGDGCSSTCNRESPAARCGNGVIEVPEPCDDGNVVNGDGCSGACVLEFVPPSSDDGSFASFCGNGVVNEGEQCDDGNRMDGDGCGAQCRLESTSPTICGDGDRTGREQCDDGNTIAGDGCDGTCRRESAVVLGTRLCGDGRLDPGEECDDGGTRDFDGCSATCFLEQGSCGDGIVQQALGEQCEPMIFRSQARDIPYDCAENCRFALPYCGNGLQDPGEQCDAGAKLNSNRPDALCREDCSLPRCGDLIRDGGEQCDDGNLKNGDGCDRLCLRESGSPVRPPVCGNGTIEIGESCDDGNTVAGDGCGATCRTEGSPGRPAVCGNGRLEAPESCDDGNRRNGDGCSSSCTDEWANIPGKTLATLRAYTLSTSRSLPGQTGPATVAVMAAGAAAGFAWMRRRRKQR